MDFSTFAIAIANNKEKNSNIHKQKNAKYENIVIPRI